MNVKRNIGQRLASFTQARILANADRIFVRGRKKLLALAALMKAK